MSNSKFHLMICILAQNTPHPDMIFHMLLQIFQIQHKPSCTAIETRRIYVRKKLKYKKDICINDESFHSTVLPQYLMFTLLFTWLSVFCFEVIGLHGTDLSVHWICHWLLGFLMLCESVLEWEANQMWKTPKVNYTFEVVYWVWIYS